MMNDIVDGKLDCLGVASPPSRPNPAILWAC